MFQLHSFESRGRRILIALFNREFLLCINLQSSLLNAPEYSANVTTSVLSLGSCGTNLGNIMQMSVEGIFYKISPLWGSPDMSTQSWSYKEPMLWSFIFLNRLTFFPPACQLSDGAIKSASKWHLVVRNIRTRQQICGTSKTFTSQFYAAGISQSIQVVNSNSVHIQSQLLIS